jgi:hypothetical protein
MKTNFFKAAGSVATSSFVGLFVGICLSSALSGRNLKANPALQVCRAQIGAVYNATSDYYEREQKFSKIPCAADYRRSMSNYGDLVMIITLMGMVIGGVSGPRRNEPSSQSENPSPR